ncbi:hypothetical protein BsWGS_14304 [Bradybaena similaris]
MVDNCHPFFHSRVHSFIHPISWIDLYAETNSSNPPPQRNEATAVSQAHANASHCATSPPKSIITTVKLFISASSRLCAMPVSVSGHGSPSHTITRVMDQVYALVSIMPCRHASGY